MLRLMSANLVLAAWWEPGSANTLDVGDLSIMLTFAVTFSGVLVAITRWWGKKLRKIVREELLVATEPIHPNSNGGLSLADVARRTQRLEESLVDMREAQSEVKDLLLRVLAHSIEVQEEPSVRSSKK